MSSIDVPRADVIKVVVELHGIPRAPGAKGPVTLELPQGSTVGDALRELGIAENEPWNAALQGKLVAPESILRDGDRLLVFEPIGGG